MKFGLFYQLPCAPTQDATARYQETIEQVVYAEGLGFDTAWLAELHFNPSFSIMPAPLILAAALAQRTAFAWEQPYCYFLSSTHYVRRRKWRSSICLAGAD
jgi:luciferase-like monooxygenase